jgi:hypothetical protein
MSVWRDLKGYSPGAGSGKPENLGSTDDE